MKASLHVVQTTERTFDEWLAGLDDHSRKSALAILGQALYIQSFRATRETKRGGSDFGRLMKKHRGWHESTTSRWKKIGDNHPMLLRQCKSLPPSWTAIAACADLKEEVIAERVKPWMTCADIADIYASLGRNAQNGGQGGKPNAAAEAEYHEADIGQYQPGRIRTLTDAWDKYVDAYQARDLEKMIVTWGVLTALAQTAHDEVTGGTTS